VKNNDFYEMMMRSQWPDPSHFPEAQDDDDHAGNGCAAIVLMFMLFMSFTLGVLTTIVIDKVW
jgi:hypothetical protein